MATQATRRPRDRGRGSSSCGMGGQGQATSVSTAGGSNTIDPPQSDTIQGDVAVNTSSGTKIRWESNGKHTDVLVQYLSVSSADCRILFNEGGRKPDDEGPPSGSDKTKIYAEIARHVFEKDNEYSKLYSEEPGKFTQAMSNRLNYLRAKYKKFHSRFSQTGAGVDPSQPDARNNLLEQVVLEFPWYEALDDIWKHNPAYAPKTFSSAPRVDYASGMIALSNHKGKETEIYEDPMDTTEVSGGHHPTIHSTPAIHSSPAVHSSPAICSAPAIHSAPAVCSAPIPTITYHNDNDNVNYMMEDDGPWETSEQPQKDFELNDQEQNSTQALVSSKHPFSSPSPPSTPPPTSCGTFRSHVDCTMNHGSVCLPPSPQSVASSSVGSLSAHMILSSHLSYTNNLGTDPEHPVHRSAPDPSSVSVVRSTDPL
ncbi:hypothetical protein BDR03DRAFT_986979 [Suillus americanus]|nr:hypothetical protein BDR03DRAFT_986979 [Suillus americanus]